MTTIIIPKDYSKPDEPSDTDLALLERYRTDPEFRAKADELHNHRMLPPPTCLDCMHKVQATEQATGPVGLSEESRFRLERLMKLAATAMNLPKDAWFFQDHNEPAPSPGKVLFALGEFVVCERQPGST